MITTTNCLSDILEMFFPSKPRFTKLTFTLPAWVKLQCFINLVGDYEITGFGRIVDDHIIDIKILPQKIKRATVDCDIDAMVDFLKNTPRDEIGQWVLDWHSHVEMAASPSCTDDSNYEEQWNARLKGQFPVMIVNKLGSIYCMNYITPNKRTQIEVNIDKDSIPLTKDEVEKIYNTCKADVEKYCTEPVYKVDNNQWKYHSDSYEDYDYNWGRGASSFKSSGIPLYEQSKKKESIKKSFDVVDNDDDEYCSSCHTYLVDADEYDRGLCNDCWEKLTPSEKIEYINYIKTTKI